jgi:hypothetical protein
MGKEMLKKHASLRLLALSLLALLSGCAGHILNDLENIDDEKTAIVIRTPILYKYSPGLGIQRDTALLAGSYYLEKRNPVGSFYRGKLPSVLSETGGKFYVLTGGFWIPSNTAEQPRLYHYLQRPQSLGSGMTFDEALARASESRAPPSPLNDRPRTDDSALANLAIQSTPTNMSPIQAGVGAGLGMAIVGALAKDGDKSPVLFPDAIGTSFNTTLKKEVANQLK